MKRLSHLFLVWPIGVYVLSMWILGLAGFSYQSIAISELMASYIPSIRGYAELSLNQHKAMFELSAAWFFSPVVPVLMLSALDWDLINDRATQKSRPLKTGFIIFATGAVLVAVVLHPDPPSGLRRSGRVIAAIFKADAAYIWGAAIIILAGLGFSSLIVGSVKIYKTLFQTGGAR